VLIAKLPDANHFNWQLISFDAFWRVFQVMATPRRNVSNRAAQILEEFNIGPKY
jgi:hypothetical protein